MNRPRVLVFMDYYLPAFTAGGPVRSVANMLKVLGGEYEFMIVTRDRDQGDRARFCGIEVNRWQRQAGARLLYASPGPAGWWAIWRTLRQESYELLYVNSFFSRRYSMFPMWLRFVGLAPRSAAMVAPRGEFAPSALGLKRARKGWYLRLVQWLGVYRNVLWHASSGYEEQDVRRVFGVASRVSGAGPLHGQPGRSAGDEGAGVRVMTALDMPSAAHSGPGGDDRAEKLPGRVRVVFLSRISRIKNLDGALRILAGVSAEVEFDIYGPRQDAGYWRQCEAAWRTLPQHIRVRYMGVVPADRAVATLGRYDLFLLPTLGENFGHVILESLLAGTPVLVSDRTPWRDLSRAGVGWDIAVEREGAFRDVLESVAGMSGAEWCQWSSRAAAYARHKCSDSRVVEDNRQLLRAALAAGGRD